MKKDNFIIFLSSGIIILIVSTFGIFNGNISNRKVNTIASECADSCFDNDSTGLLDKNQKEAMFEDKLVEVPDVVFEKDSPTHVLGAVSDDKWIEVDLSDQKIRAWEGGNLYLESLISSGLPGTPTPQGEFRIWIKLRATRMQGGSGRGYYNLPNVPYTMYFENESIPNWKGYGLHGAYWHNDFGRTKSHGCVNLPIPVAKQLYEWTLPQVPEGKNMVRADADHLGTRIVIHE